MRFVTPYYVVENRVCQASHHVHFNDLTGKSHPHIPPIELAWFLRIFTKFVFPSPELGLAVTSAEWNEKFW